MKRLTAYYFRAHLYTLVPRHVREDMQWMAEVGTNYVAVGVLEQDLFAAVENLQILQREAERAGMKMLAVPSRWGGLLAGGGKVPSIFTARNPDTHAKGAGGSDGRDLPLGPISSVHHPATFDFFCQSLQQLLTIVDVAGLIWDEPKNLGMIDRSPAARAKISDDAPLSAHTQAAVDFLARVGAFARGLKPDLRLTLFTYAHTKQAMLETLAGMSPLDDIGCDGRPWSNQAAAELKPDELRDEDRSCKSLIDDGPRFIKAARRNGKDSFFLIENHNLDVAAISLLDRHMPATLALKPEHLAYYYYPRAVADPDRLMQIVARHLRAAGRE